MAECKIGNSEVKIYGVAKGSGMIFPNMATTLDLFLLMQIFVLNFETDIKFKY